MTLFFGFIYFLAFITNCTIPPNNDILEYLRNIILIHFSSYLKIKNTRINIFFYNSVFTHKKLQFYFCMYIHFFAFHNLIFVFA